LTRVIVTFDTKRGELLQSSSLACLHETQSNASPKQRSGKGGGRGSDIRREATAEQSGYRPCRFDALNVKRRAVQQTR